ncbi:MULTISPECIES: FAD-containing oxidoreductase [unclassified Legionella]|uniref:FAD-containing oxidoreductase n=1 Tax=unclassified Legionella TaxID=2622702 RepID=UPI001056410D|nr:MULTISPECIES: FAD-containing oxidoreductase [unclassified Legionella]MDI9818592.1 FAD-containing oxidoreductase [Legionella sp. PL877]
MTNKFDVIVIGAGQAGPSLAVQFANMGKKVAIIERKLFGGTCVNNGCIPSKTLIASAKVAHLTREAQEFGVMAQGSITVDMKRVKARKDAIVDKASKGLEDWLENTPNCHVYKGHARFENPHIIRVGDELLEGEKIFINVGARAVVPSIPGLEKIHYFTNSSIMEVDFVPQHLIIIGGSYIGLEFAQMYRRFGAKVTVIEKASKLISREDADISEAVKEILQSEGVDIRLNAECIELDKQNDEIVVRLDCTDSEKIISGSHLLFAIGRIANTDDLGLDKAGIEVDKNHFIKVDDYLQTNIGHIWALGECNGKGAFTHTSYNDYEIVAANLIGNQSRRVSDRILTYGLFIDPPLGRAGMTEAQALDSVKPALIGKRAMTQVKRAVIKGETQGFIKVLVDEESKLILGAAVLGVGGDEIIHSILDVMYAKKPYTVIQNAVHIHPTVTELIPTMLGELKPLKH